MRQKYKVGLRYLHAGTMFFLFMLYAVSPAPISATSSLLTAVPVGLPADMLSCLPLAIPFLQKFPPLSFHLLPIQSPIYIHP